MRDADVEGRVGSFVWDVLRNALGKAGGVSGPRCRALLAAAPQH